MVAYLLSLMVCLIFWCLSLLSNLTSWRAAFCLRSFLTDLTYCLLERSIWLRRSLSCNWSSCFWRTESCSFWARSFWSLSIWALRSRTWPFEEELEETRASWLDCFEVFPFRIFWRDFEMALLKSARTNLLKRCYKKGKKGKSMNTYSCENSHWSAFLQPPLRWYRQSLFSLKCQRTREEDKDVTYPLPDSLNDWDLISAWAVVEARCCGLDRERGKKKIKTWERKTWRYLSSCSNLQLCGDFLQNPKI